MKIEALKDLVAILSIEEKVGQLVQLTGDFFDSNNDVIETGPMKKIGFQKNKYELAHTGSLLNVVDAEEIYKIQKKYLENSKHKIPLLFMADIIYGYKTIFPIPLAQSGSWNFPLIEKSAKVIAKECYDAGIHVTFSPMVDLVRDPRWGRVLESPGEDPLLAKQYAKSMVRGIQGMQGDQISENHIAACVKHFAAYGAPQAGLEYGAVELSTDSLQNYYLPSYKAAIDADVKLVMTAFNTLNGIPCTGNKWLNKDILRETFNFTGLLISDYAAIEELKIHGFTENDQESAQLAFESSVDIDMKTSVYANHLPDLAKKDTRIMKLLDEAVLRVLQLKNALGLFEDPYRGLSELSNSHSVLSDKHKEVSQTLAEESIVLLKNKDILPIDENKKIALVGPYVDEPSALGFWAITGETKDTITLKAGLDSIKEEMKWKVQVAKGSNILEESDIESYAKYASAMSVDEKPKQQLLEEAIEIAKESNIVVMCLGESIYQSGEGGSRTTPVLPDEQVKLLKEIKKLGKQIVLIVYAGRPLILDNVIDDVSAVLYAWFPGTMGGYALANLLSGKVNPSGKLAMTMPRSIGQIPIFYNTYSSGRPIVENNPNHRFASRYLDEKNTPLYCFGYGLSYTEFEYSGFEIDKESMTEQDEIRVSIKVRNVGEKQGKEIVQLYLHDVAARVVRPIKELKDFKKITLNPHEERRIDFKITIDMLKYYNSNEEWASEPGKFEVIIGKDSNDQRFKGSFILED
ncbi:beta-glucosidase BglX [Marinilactibacillus psychrotolerans]|uniref:Beta-glucosidase n=1 Tax=Marinilactibacillus psychrotolerans TaxID=191770 RepID=A0AAV3W9C0_9LACT|nr:beta-glucosidase BglX [Marinilactibacillus psychrotolerans]GEL66876.1 beta-glucosidase [Marinilactibacillus psychrotolerans]GEQ35966.1 beta-glucosidase [Marinilactibacillus psychrotolerans]SDC41090.1 beta-glucosidase [Marinilactibacillus psychrotolerans]